jgi:glycosyltransferase involved in cell wall biosynthesis
MNIVWNGPFSDPSGYGKAARDYFDALSRTEHNVYIHNIRYYQGNSTGHISPDLAMRLEAATWQSGQYDIHVEHKTPNELSLIHGRSVGYTVWETSCLPPGFVRSCNYKDEIWTASEYSKQALINGGVERPIEVIPHIIDTDKFRPMPRRKKMFVVLFQGEFTTRKGADLAIRSFARAFDKGDNVLLLLKTYLINSVHYGHRYIENKVKEILYEEKGDRAPAYRIYDRFVPDDELPNIYNAADVFLFPSRGEGFGITLAEAMACGKLAIVPTLGGHTDFTSHPYSVIYVDSQSVPIPDHMLEDDRKIYRGQNWIEPNISCLTAALYDAYHNFDGYEQTRKNAREAIIKHSHRDVVVNKIQGRLECL